MSVSQSSFPGGVARCQHIKSNGTQCASPALKSRPFCYYHQQSRPEAVELYIDGERYSDGEIVMPLFEDAHSIQVVLRQVTQLLLQRRIDRKDAALALYALQIASSNLKRMEHEKPRPTQVVIDPETVAQTPLGMTPWSATGAGHDPDDFESASDDSAAAKALPERADEDLPPGIIHACQPVNGTKRHPTGWPLKPAFGLSGDVANVAASSHSYDLNSRRCAGARAPGSPARQPMRITRPISSKSVVEGHGLSTSTIP